MSSTLAAVVLGVSSAVVYGAATVVQHRLAQSTRDREATSAAGLRALLRRPLFLFAIVGDGLGFLLQVVALTIGSVVLVQPLVVLMLPASFAVDFWFTRRRPRRTDHLGVLGVVGGLVAFLVAIGQPAGARLPSWQGIAGALLGLSVFGLLAVAVATKAGNVGRAAILGAVAGAWFGGLAVLVDAVSTTVASGGYESLLDSACGQLCLGGIVLLGAGGMVIMQMSFQIGALGATLPANLAVDPLVAVLLGATVLHEQLPISPARVVLYVSCLAVVVAGAICLAQPTSKTTQSRTDPTTGREASVSTSGDPADELGGRRPLVRDIAHGTEAERDG